MAEVLRSFDEPIRHASGTYHARVVGRYAEDGMWEGWLEFVPMEKGGELVVSAAESRQPERVHLEYWAQGLSPVYVEGSLERALHPIIRGARDRKSTRLNSSHSQISYAVFCLKKKK